MSGTDTYLIANALDHARERLAAGAAWMDPWTTGQLLQLGIGDGWSCLELGAGGGSIAEWLCQKVGQLGHVVATDIDTRFVAALDYPNLEVQQHNVVADELPRSRYDLVHARLLVSHLRAPDAALAKMVAALKPGGWLLVEDFDHLTCGVVDPASDPGLARAYQSMWTADLEFMRTHGISLDTGRRLYGMCRELGLQNLQAESYAAVATGGSPFAKVSPPRRASLSRRVPPDGHVGCRY